MSCWASKNLMQIMLKLKSSKELEWNVTKKVKGSYYICKIQNCKTAEFIKHITRKYKSKVHFNTCEIKMILLLYREIVGGNIEHLLFEDDLKAFLSIQFDLTNSKSLDGIARAFKNNTKEKGINSEDFLLGLSVFLRGTLLERARFTFKAFDIDGDGFLRRKDEFAKYLQDSFDPASEAVQFDLDEPARDTANYVFQKFIDPSDKSDVDLMTFTRLCSAEPILMECLSSIYPDDRKIITFQNLLFCKVYSPSYLTLPKIWNHPEEN